MIQNQNVTPVMSLRQLMQAISSSKSFIYSEIKRGSLPKPLRFGRSSRWLASDIQAYIEARANANKKEVK